jgi:hypothetical protein
MSKAFVERLSGLECFLLIFDWRKNSKHKIFLLVDSDTHGKFSDWSKVSHYSVDWSVHFIEGSAAKDVNVETIETYGYIGK